MCYTSVHGFCYFELFPIGCTELMYVKFRCFRIRGCFRQLVRVHLFYAYRQDCREPDLRRWMYGCPSSPISMPALPSCVPNNSKATYDITMKD